MKELQPLHENVILDLSEEKAEQRTASGLIIPDTAKEKPQIAKILAIGTIENPAISVGDAVLFKKYSGTEIEYEGKKLLIIPYADLLAKVVETEQI
ncbi:MAG: co-chaperone GroES [Bacteroidales bacterium]|jgi:chaperonin GroES|nr:co-chaperone GroES [Bacteroidales bacterium]MCK9447500.1 co-chaperone GroES [Bacteroidales bacterium]MDD3700626.1 co-chaperone GroES [Bacteroidales bacterium]MDY0368251.1 co-chaperone GroES [Bacteroidales bacterium]